MSDRSDCRILEGMMTHASVDPPTRTLNPTELLAERQARGARSVGPFITLDDSAVLLMTINNHPTDGELDDHFKAFGDWVDQNRSPVAMVVDIRGLMGLTAEGAF